MNNIITMTMAMLAVIFMGCGGDAADQGAENGSECSTDTDCQGLCLQELGPEQLDPITFEDGFCTNECLFGEDGGPDVGCAENELCLMYDPERDGEGEKFCFSDCASDSDCRDENYTCAVIDFHGTTACLPVDAVSRVVDTTNETIRFQTSEVYTR